MNVWEDTFGDGSQFQRVFWLAPVISVAILGVMVGFPEGGLLGAVISFAFGLGLVALNYVIASYPAKATWFMAFRMARRLGLRQGRAVLLAAPAMAFAASVVISLLFYLTAMLDYGVRRGVDLGDLREMTLLIALVLMPVALLVAVQWNGKGDLPAPLDSCDSDGEGANR